NCELGCLMGMKCVFPWWNPLSLRTRPSRNLLIQLKINTFFQKAKNVLGRKSDVQTAKSTRSYRSGSQQMLAILEPHNAVRVSAGQRQNKGALQTMIRRTSLALLLLLA